MKNDTSLRYYSFFVHVWQRVKGKPLGDKVQAYYVDFLNRHDYGDNLLPVTFNLFIEKDIDVDKQDDNVSVSSYMGIPPTARLNVHIDYDYYANADETERYKAALNGLLYILRYWLKYLKQHKSTPLERIIEDYTDTLRADGLLLSEDVIKKIYIKIITPFRFHFMNYRCQGIREKQILFNTNHIEKFLNNNLYKIDFGKSVNTVYFSYDILDYARQDIDKYIDNEKKYQYGKSKDLSIMEQYDKNLFYDEFFDISKCEQVAYLHKGMLEAIFRIKDMKRKPKDFDVDRFYAEIDRLMTEYEQEHCID
ncbi:hypothetical protein D0T84_03015 [Dysgonomonas sp. 521]|uniref:hypothetical protein n=1 Tax=Dysgonomonas sp. 521 TaxID=2302932 RepID=UPI0013D4BBB1|nr:hypothetical protein [Dysgonomonas sp. 521]NDV93889.1 hypothetical protein [Dysgonomonas sp. 521]